MFTKYFNLVKALFSAIFESGGESVAFADYLYVLGFTFAIIGVVIATIAALVLIIIIPIVVYKKLTKKDNKTLYELHDDIATKTDNPAIVSAAIEKISKIEKTLKIKKICFVAGVVFIYVPFVIPTVLFVIGKLSVLI